MSAQMNKRYYEILWYAKDRKDLEEVNFDPNQLVSVESEYRNPILNALIACEDYDTALKLIRLCSDNLDPNQCDWEGKNALILAAKMYNGDKVFLALLDTFKSKININAQDKDGYCALHFLVMYKKANLIKKFFEFSPKINLMDNKGRTPINCYSLPVSELRTILLSIDIEPERDVMSRGNSLRWHFRFLCMKDQENLFAPYLSKPSNKENMMILKSNIMANEVSSDGKGIQAYIKWKNAILAKENQFEGQSVIQCIQESQLESSLLTRLTPKNKTKPLTPHQSSRTFLPKFSTRTLIAAAVGIGVTVAVVVGMKLKSKASSMR